MLFSNDYMDEPGEYVDFMAKYKDWVAIKRLGIRPETKPEEVVFHLANVRSLMDTKMYSFLGINTEALDKVAEQISSGKGRGYASLADAVKELERPDVKKAAFEACQNKAASKLAETYILNKVINNMNFDTAISPATLTKLYPDVKLKLPPGVGRKKKGPKKP